MADPDVLRGLVIFEGSALSPAMVPLRRSFHAAWGALVEAQRLRVILTEALWQATDPVLLAALLRQVEAQVEEVELARDATADAVDLGAAHRLSFMFHIGEDLPVSGTELARREAFENLTRDDLDRPLTDADRARIRRRRRA